MYVGAGRTGRGVTSPIPGIKHEGAYLPLLTLTWAPELEAAGVPKTGTATWIGDVNRVAPWKKLLKAIAKKAEED